MKSDSPHALDGPDARARAVELNGIRFRWREADDDVLDIDKLWFEAGEQVFIGGASGSGKTTLLSLLAGIQEPRKGTLSMLGRDITAMSPVQRDHFRADHIGYIFQMFNLVPYLSVIENVTLPLRFSKRRRQKAGGAAAGDEAIRLLQHLGLDTSALRDRPVTDLSVGQQQRVAAARALIGRPEILIADEPTSALDADNRENFLRLLFQECAREGATLVFVSHDRALAPLFDRAVVLEEAAGCRASGVGSASSLPEIRDLAPDTRDKGAGP